MANPIDITVTQQALKELDTLIAKVGSAREGFLSLGQSIIDSSKNVSKISTPSGLGNNSAMNAQINADIKKQTLEVEKLHATIAKKAETSRLAEIRLQQAREKAFDSFERNANKEAALNKKNETAYQRIQNSVAILTKTYQDLAIRKQLGSTLTVKEEAQLVSLTTRISTYQKALLATDAQIGKNQRNVGNYASGYNALGNSINQLSREAPAFANSVNTGFMALSNNIPALFDALGGIRAQNKALIAEGKPTVGIFKQLAGAVFSWQTLLSVGVTLLTIYGGKIIDTLFGLTEMEKAQKALNEEMLNAKNTITSEITQLQSLTSIVNDHNESSFTRKLAYDEIKKTLPGLTSVTYEQAVATGELTRVTDLYISSLIQKNIVEAEAKAISEEETKLNKRSEQTTKERMGTFKYVMNTITGQQGQALRNSQKAYRKEDELLEESISNRKKALIKSQEDFLKTQSLLNPFVTKPEKINNKIEEDRLKAIADAKRKELELQLANIDLLLNNEDSYYSDRLLALDANFIKRTEIAKLDYDEELRLSKGNQDKQKTALINFQLEKIKLIENYTKQKSNLEALDLDPITKMTTATGLDPLKELAKSGENVSKVLEDIGKKAEETEKKMQSLRNETNNWLNSFSSEFLQNSGMGSLETFFDGTFDKLLAGAETTEEKFAVTFNAIAESAQEAFNFIANASQTNFDNERKRIEDQQAIAISYAGGSAVAIAKINDDAEKRKKEIANRENKAKQKQAIFNIAIDTAQAIMATVGKSGFAGLPLALILGALGAAQIAMVATQKIPQYFDGTDNHTGGAMIVNDGKGSNYKEKVVLPSGQVILPQGRNVLMNAPKGTKVLTHEQQLQEMMQDNGISMSRTINQNNGMTANEMDSVLGKHFSNIKTHNTTFDKRGFQSYIQNGNSRTILTSNRVSGSGISV